MLNFITSPLASLFIAVMGTQFFQSFVTIVLDESGFSEFYIGLVHSASYLGLLIAALYAEKVIKNVGHIRNFCLASSIMAGTIILQAYSVNVYLWIFCRFLSGAAVAALVVTIESWLIADSSVENRGKTLAIYMITYYLSQAIGPQIFHFVNVSRLVHESTPVRILFANTNIFQEGFYLGRIESLLRHVRAQLHLPEFEEVIGLLHHHFQLVLHHALYD